MASWACHAHGTCFLYPAALSISLAVRGRPSSFFAATCADKDIKLRVPGLLHVFRVAAVVVS